MMGDAISDESGPMSTTRTRITYATRRGAVRTPLLGGVVVVLLAALVAGGVLVARTFVEPAQEDGRQGGTIAPRPPAPRRAEAIEAAIEAASQYSRNQEYAKAQAVLAKAAEHYPQDQPLRLEFARVLVAQQQFEAAYSEYQAAIALDAGRTSSGEPVPEWPTTTGATNSSNTPAAKRLLGNPALHFEAGTVASKAGLLERAEEHYAMAQSGDPGDARYPLFLGMVQLRLNKSDAAQASLVRAVTLDSGQAAAWGTLAELSLKNNQLALSLQHIEKARAIESQTPRWRLVQAKALKRRQEQGDVEFAAQLLLAMDRSELVKPEAAGTLAECYGLLGKPQDAAALYEEVYRANPKNAEAALATARWHQRAGNAERALYYAKTAAMLGNEAATAIVEELRNVSAETANDVGNK